MLGIMTGNIYLQGKVGVISLSGTLGYEAASQMKAMGIGISTSVGIGGDPINGSSFLDHLALFEEDPETEAVLMIGEIGGPQEAEASAWIKDNTIQGPFDGGVKIVAGGVGGVIQISGNVIDGAAAAISGRSQGPLTVSANTISDADIVAIRVESDAVVTGNWISDCVEGIRVAGLTTKAVVVGNSFNQVTFPFRGNGSGTLVGNTFTDGATTGVEGCPPGAVGNAGLTAEQLESCQSDLYGH